MSSHDDSAGDALSCVVAIDLAHENQLIGALIGPDGTVHQRDSGTLGGATGEDAVQAVLDFTGALIQQSDRPVTAVGIGTPGIVDEKGTVRYATVLQWRDVPLAARLEERFGVPATVGNDIDVTTLAAVRFRDLPVRDLLLISLDNSIGMGIMVGGHLVAGEHYNAGEIAHVTVVEDGVTCLCGRRGCIVAYMRAARAAVSARFVSEETKQGALIAAGRAIGLMVAPIASALNLTTVIIAGPAELVTPELIRAAASTCEDRTLPLLNTRVEITALRDDADLVLLGAAARAMTVRDSAERNHQ